MPGQITHIHLVNSVSSLEELKNLPGVMPSISEALLLDQYKPFCRLGAVSPDTPMFVKKDTATGWSNVMHYLRPADFIRNAIPHLLELPFGSTEGKQCIAWLFGYVGHIVADYTIHPVVTEKVGKYNRQTAAAHMLCECNQDVYLFEKHYGGDLVGSDFQEWTGMKDCMINGNINRLNSSVKSLWKKTLKEYSYEAVKQYVRLQNNTIEPDNWFASYMNFYGRWGVRNGVKIPKLENLDRDFVENLPTPESAKTIHFDDLVAKAQGNILAVWIELANSLSQDDIGLFKLKNASLDEGRDDSGKLIYWP